MLKTASPLCLGVRKRGWVLGWKEGLSCRAYSPTSRLFTCISSQYFLQRATNLSKSPIKSYRDASGANSRRWDNTIRGSASSLLSWSLPRVGLGRKVDLKTCSTSIFLSMQSMLWGKNTPWTVWNQATFLLSSCGMGIFQRATWCSKAQESTPCSSIRKWRKGDAYSTWSSSIAKSRNRAMHYSQRLLASLPWAMRRKMSKAMRQQWGEYCFSVLRKEEKAEDKGVEESALYGQYSERIVRDRQQSSRSQRDSCCQSGLVDSMSCYAVSLSHVTSIPFSQRQGYSISVLYLKYRFVQNNLKGSLLYMSRSLLSPSRNRQISFTLSALLLPRISQYSLRAVLATSQ